MSSFLHWDKRPGLYGLRFAESFGCNPNGTHLGDVLECMKNVSTAEMVSRAEIFLHYPWTGPIVWKPCMDGRYLTKDPLFPAEPRTLLETGDYHKVPLIIGANSNEGVFNLIGYLANLCNISDVEERWDSLGPLILFHRSLDETMPEDVKLARSIKRYYFGSEGKISVDTMGNFMRMMGDSTFYGGIELFLQ